MQIASDIETIPSQEPDALQEVCSHIAPPATLKKAESIAAWWANEADGAAQAAWRKQSLDGGLHGEIVSIAVCKVEDPDESWVRCRAQGESEAALLREFFSVVEGWERDFAATLPAVPSAWPYDPPWPVAHNAAFDLGFLWTCPCAGGAHPTLVARSHGPRRQRLRLHHADVGRLRWVCEPGQPLPRPDHPQPQRHRHEWCPGV